MALCCPESPHALLSRHITSPLPRQTRRAAPHSRHGGPRPPRQHGGHGGPCRHGGRRPPRRHGGRRPPRRHDSYCGPPPPRLHGGHGGRRPPADTADTAGSVPLANTADTPRPPCRHGGQWAALSADTRGPGGNSTKPKAQPNSGLGSKLGFASGFCGTTVMVAPARAQGLEQFVFQREGRAICTIGKALKFLNKTAIP